MVIALLALSLSLFVLGSWSLWSGWSARFSADRIERRLAGMVDVGSERGRVSPSQMGRMLERIGHRLASPQAEEVSPDTLRSFSSSRVGLYRLIAARFILAALLMATGLLLVATGAIRGPLLSIAPFVAAIAIFFGAKPLMRSLEARRQSEMMRELPFLLDVLILMLRSGASLDQAFRQIAKLDPRSMPHLVPITIELVADVDGGIGYEAAFAKWSDKIGSDNAQELANLFTQCLIGGLEISKRLKQFSALQVERRLLMARETAGRRLTHLTVVTMMFFIPPLILLLAAPVMHNTINALKVFNHG